MKHLIIIGARGAGREVYMCALNSREIDVDYNVKGFLDDKTDALEGYEGYPPILGSVEAYIPQEDDVFICALGDPVWRKIYVEKILAKGGVFTNVIEKTASIGLNVRIGVGCILRAYTQLSCDVKVGDYNYFQPFVFVGHDAKIGNFCHFNTYASMGGYSEVEDETVLHTGSILLPHTKAMKSSVIAAGSVAMRDVKENSTVVGVPAREFFTK